jgi:hypothetical protein
MSRAIRYDSISEGFQTCTSTYYRAEMRGSFMLVIRSLLNDLEFSAVQYEGERERPEV